MKEHPINQPENPFAHIREISSGLKALDSIPLSGMKSSFPWLELAQRLAEIFEKEDLSIEKGEWRWCEANELFEGIGDRSISLNFSFPNLHGQAFFIASEMDIAALIAFLLNQESHAIQVLEDLPLMKSFYNFFALETLFFIDKYFSKEGIAPVLSNDANHPEHPSLCLDIKLNWQQHLFRGRLLVSSELQRSWAEHFSRNSKTPNVDTPLAESTSAILKIEAGKVILSIFDWLSAKEGDFLVLDHCSISPKNLEGEVLLTHEGKNVFSDKIKNGNLKIIERS